MEFHPEFKARLVLLCPSSTIRGVRLQEFLVIESTPDPDITWGLLKALEQDLALLALGIAGTVFEEEPWTDEEIAKAKTAMAIFGIVIAALSYSLEF